jgi:hypothetical protein
MRSRRHQTRFTRRLVAIGTLGCLLAGCAVVGPTAIRSGRLAYNEAITETNNQQLLKMVIENRYGEQGNLLAVSSVTANVSVTTSSALQFGFGDTDDYAGNLVPFRAGSIYEENPTISYVPVAGEKYTRQLMSPLPINLLALFAGTLTDPASIYIALVAHINGIHNPDFLFYPSEADPRFTRFVTIMTVLTQAQCLHWIEDPHDRSFSLVIDDYAPAYTTEVRELLELLGLPAPRDRSTRLILPVSLALHGRENGGIGIITRSVFDLGEILSAAIEIPAHEKIDGVAVNYPPPGLAGQNLRIHHASDRPKHAYISVKYRGGWFYIDDDDQATKGFFRLMSALWSVTIAENTTQGTAAPVLTVPVSR